MLDKHTRVSIQTDGVFLRANTKIVGSVVWLCDLTLRGRPLRLSLRLPLRGCLLTHWSLNMKLRRFEDNGYYWYSIG